MTYPTLMVHLELGRPNSGLLKITGDLAERFRAGVIGIAARQPLQLIYGEGYVSGEIFEQDQRETERELKEAEAEFRAALGPRVATLQWRASSTYGYLSDYIASEARCADLILTGVARGDMLDSSRSTNTADLIMQAGRPVLTVPTTATSLSLAHVLVAWKDTRETRRAASDALPLLERATRVSVVELAAEDELEDAAKRVSDVVVWLRGHGIEADGTASISTGDDATALYAIGQDKGSDVIVAGAYGHSRLREWALGGVTRDLLLSANRCSFLSH